MQIEITDELIDTITNLVDVCGYTFKEVGEELGISYQKVAAIYYAY